MTTTFWDIRTKFGIDKAEDDFEEDKNKSNMTVGRGLSIILAS